MAGGFGLCGVPEALIEAVRKSGAKDLTFVSNNAGVDGIGLGVLLETGQIRKMISSYVGENKIFASSICRASWSSSSTRRARWPSASAPAAPAFRPSSPRPASARSSPRARKSATSTARPIVMETGLVADVSLVHAWKGDTEGNLVYRKTARNFNPMMATAGKADGRRGRASGRAGRDRPRPDHHAGHLRAAHRARRRRAEAHRAAHHPQARRRLRFLEALHMPWTRDQMAARAAKELQGRLLRQSRHRHSDAGLELHPARHERAAAERERHARHGAVPVRGRGGPGPHQRRQADGDPVADDELLLQRRFLRDDPRRPHRSRHPRRDAGLRERRSRELDDPGQDGQRHGRRDGPRRRRQDASSSSWSMRPRTGRSSCITATCR